MKTVKFLTLSSIMLLLSACGGNSADAASASSESAAPAEKTVQTAKAADPVVVLKAGEQIPAAQGKPVVVDFNATWCGPCRQFAPTFHKVAAKYADKALFVSVDVDKCPELAAVYGVQGIPTVVYITPDGSVNQTVGLIPEAEFEANVKAMFR